MRNWIAQPNWARLNVWVAKTAFAATVTGYAYETVPTRPIIAGKVKGRCRHRSASESRSFGAWSVGSFGVADGAGCKSRPINWRNPRIRILE